MTNDQAQITAVGDHHYAITLREGEDVVQLVVYADPATVTLIASDRLDERRLVENTLTFLLQRQRADDLPPVLDLADVAAGYDAWSSEMSAKLNATGRERSGQAQPRQEGPECLRGGGCSAVSPP